MLIANKSNDKVMISVIGERDGVGAFRLQSGE